LVGSPKADQVLAETGWSKPHVRRSEVARHRMRGLLPAHACHFFLAISPSVLEFEVTVRYQPLHVGRFQGVTVLCSRRGASGW